MSNLTLSIHDISILNGNYSKQEAIKLIAESMIAANLVTNDYTQAMYDRDAQISTF